MRLVFFDYLSLYCICGNFYLWPYGRHLVESNCLGEVNQTSAPQFTGTFFLRGIMATRALAVFCKCLEIGNTRGKTPDHPSQGLFYATLQQNCFNITISCSTNSCTEFLAVGVSDRFARCVLANIAQKLGGLIQHQFAQI